MVLSDEMKQLILLMLSMASLLFSGCEDRSRGAGDTELQTVAEVGEESGIEYQIGDYDDQGRLVVFAIADKYRVLEREAALVFRNVGTESEPRAVYDLTTKAGHHRHSSLQELINDLRSQNVSKAIDFYGGTCGGPVWYGLPEDVVDQFFGVIKNEGYELCTESPDGIMNSICTCTN